MVEKTKCTLYSGGMKGAEAAFGEAAEKWGLQETNFSYEGHVMAREKNVVVLSPPHGCMFISRKGLL